MKVAVIGSRDACESAFDMILEQIPIGCSEIISGGARGVDFLAKRAAKELGLKFTCCRPNYKKYGRVAPLVRNSEIVDKADYVLAFWNGYSKGTRHALVCCIKRHRPFRIYLLNQQYFICKSN
ncbi:MAG TPA: SLOG family protein [Ruminiclostridium sp.]|nr:SLOG family protein [Ruminiclostridium sp.]